MPRLLDAQFRERARLHPIRVSLDLRLTPLSTAEMLLAPDDADISARDLVELFDQQGSAGFFRVSEVETEPGFRRTVRLEHSLCTLSDGIVNTLSFTGTVRDCLSALLAHQPVSLWTLGDCDVSDELTVLFTCGCEDLLTAVLRLLSLLPDSYALAFEQSAAQWVLHLRALSDADTCEGRLSRNLSSVAIRMDATTLCTRLYPFGAGQGTERVSLLPLTGTEYLESDAVSLWGVVGKTFTSSAIYDAVTLQDVAARYLERHREPTVSVAAQAVDLSAATGEDADSFRLGQMCRLTLPEHAAVLHERIIAVEEPDVYGAPGLVKLTLCNRIRDLSDEIGALLRESTADKLLGGRVSEVVDDNRATGTVASPIVHYFTMSDWAALLDVRFSFTPDDGVSVTDVRIDDTYVPDTVWASGSFSGLAYLSRDALGLPSVGTHRFILYPDSGDVGSRVVMKVIEAA